MVRGKCALALRKPTQNAALEASAGEKGKRNQVFLGPSCIKVTLTEHSDSQMPERPSSGADKGVVRSSYIHSFSPHSKNNLIHLSKMSPKPIPEPHSGPKLLDCSTALTIWLRAPGRRHDWKPGPRLQDAPSLPNPPLPQKRVALKILIKQPSWMASH